MTITITIPASPTQTPISITFSEEELTEFFNHYANAYTSPMASALFQKKMDSSVSGNASGKTTTSPAQAQVSTFSGHVLHDVPLLGANMSTLLSLQRASQAELEVFSEDSGSESDSDSDSSSVLEFCAPTKRWSKLPAQTEVSSTNNLQVGPLSPYHNFMQLFKLLEYYRVSHQNLPQVSRAVSLCYLPIFSITVVELTGVSIRPSVPCENSPRQETTDIHQAKVDLVCWTRTHIKVSTDLIAQTEEDSILPSTASEKDPFSTVARIGSFFTGLPQVDDYYHTFWKRLPSVSNAVENHHSTASIATTVMLQAIKGAFTNSNRELSSASSNNTSHSESDRSDTTSSDRTENTDSSISISSESSNDIEPVIHVKVQIPLPTWPSIVRRRRHKKRAQRLPSFGKPRRMRRRAAAMTYVIYGSA